LTTPTAARRVFPPTTRFTGKQGPDELCSACIHARMRKQYIFSIKS
jgi:hypothetical protein